MSCEAIVGLVLDRQSISALERIGKKTKFLKMLGTALSGGVLYNIFFKSNIPVVGFNIKQVDWHTYTTAMIGLDDINSAVLRKDFEDMWITYENRLPYDHKQVKFWKQLAMGCG